MKRWPHPAKITPWEKRRTSGGCPGTVVNQGRPELESVIAAASLTNDRMNRPAGFVLTSIAIAFLLGAPRLCLGQTQLVPVKIAVPTSLRSSPFDRDRYLLVPHGFQIRVVSRIPAARFLASTPEGGLLVSQPSRGKIWWISPKSADASPPLLAAVGLRHPHGMVFTAIRGTTYVYVSESNEISRFRYDPNGHRLLNREVVVPNLPDASSPELGGAYGHQLKNLTIGPDSHLYVDIASSSNADPKDTTSDPIRCAIYRYDLEGGNRTLFAKGIRNAEGLAFAPGTNALWAVVNGTDNIRFPFHRSWKGSGSDDYGKRITSYIDDHPPDTFIHVKLGADYGGHLLNRIRTARAGWITCLSTRATRLIAIGANTQSQSSPAAIKVSKRTLPR